MVIVRLDIPNRMVTKGYRKGVYEWGRPESGDAAIGLSVQMNRRIFLAALRCDHRYSGARGCGQHENQPKQH